MIAVGLMTSTLEFLAWAPPGWGATLAAGLAKSILIAIGAFSLGLLIGIGGAYGKLYGGPVTRDLLGIYTTVVRAVPLKARSCSSSSSRAACCCCAASRAYA